MVFAERLRRRHADRKDPSAWQKVKIVAAQQVVSCSARRAAADLGGEKSLRRTLNPIVTRG